MVSFLGFIGKGKDKSVSLDVPPILPDTSIDKNMAFDRGDYTKDPIGPSQMSDGQNLEGTNRGFSGSNEHNEPRRLPENLVSPEVKGISISVDENADSSKSTRPTESQPYDYSRLNTVGNSNRSSEETNNPFDFYKKNEDNYRNSSSNSIYKGTNPLEPNSFEDGSQSKKWNFDGNNNPKETNLIDERMQAQNERASISFFKELERRFNEEKSELYSSLSSGLLHKMKDYHESLKSGRHFFLGEKDIDDAVYSYLLELRELESEWLIRSREFESARNLLLEKESEIEKKLARFKNVIRAAEKFRMLGKKTTYDKAFRLQNGVLLYSVEDLLYELSKMDESVFRHHVNEERNDFSTWVEHVFSYHEIADHIKNAKSPGEMIKIIREF